MTNPLKNIVLIGLLILVILGCQENHSTENITSEKWILIYSNPKYNFTDIHFIDDKVGFAVGVLGIIIKTVDGGDKWEVVDSAETPSTSLRKIVFFDNRIGLIVGNNGIIKRTADGGNTWTTTFLSPQNSINDICIINENKCFIVMGGSIYKTINTGIDWDKIYSYPDAYKTFSDLHFSSDSIGYGLLKQQSYRYSGAIIKTIDSGKNWTVVDTSFNNPLYSCFFVTNDLGYVTDLEGNLFKTINGGISWTFPTSKNLGGVTFINFLSPYVGYGYKLDGKLIKTYDGGQNWIVIISDNTESLNSFFYNKSNQSIYITSNSGIYKCVSSIL